MRHVSISLPRKAVSHWSTAMYGVGPWGHIMASVNSGGIVSNDEGRTVLLNIDTPGGKGEGLHGGARNINVALTPKEARAAARLLTDAAKAAEGKVVA